MEALSVGSTRRGVSAGLSIAGLRRGFSSATWCRPRLAAGRYAFLVKSTESESEGTLGLDDNGLSDPASGSLMLGLTNEVDGLSARAAADTGADEDLLRGSFARALGGSGGVSTLTPPFRGDFGLVPQSLYGK